MILPSLDIVFGAFFCSTLSLFLDYCLGRPGHEFNPHAIFARYTVWLSRKTMTRYGLIKNFHSQRTAALLKATDDADWFRTKINFDKLLYQQASELFTYEYALGICPFCTGVWISAIFFGFMFLVIPLTLFGFITGVLLAHFFLRIINKL